MPAEYNPYLFIVLLAVAAVAFALTPLALPTPVEGDSAALTNFERKYQLEGRPIYRAVYARVE